MKTSVQTLMVQKRKPAESGVRFDRSQRTKTSLITPAIPQRQSACACGGGCPQCQFSQSQGQRRTHDLSDRLNRSPVAIQRTIDRSPPTLHSQTPPPTISPLPQTNPTLIQRRVYEGHDHGGRYEINDEDCTLTYHQNWFFTFRTSQTQEEQQHYMEAARQQIEDVWSNKFPLLPDGESCPCHRDGMTVQVVMHPFARDRQESRGFTIVVTPTEDRGFTNQPIRRIDLGTEHETPLSMGGGLTQRRIAHEFGHTIGLTDEYHGWAALFNTAGSRDRPSIMHSGDQVRPRHYQHFADLVNLEVGAGCTYSPAGRRLPEFENPVTRWSGIPFTFLPERSDFVIGLNMDRRISNTAMLGLIYPTVGLMSMWDEQEQRVATGPTVGLRLNQIAHPLFVNVRTGVLFDPSDPTSTQHLRLPISLDLGLRGEGFQVGVNYTPIVDILNDGRWTHVVGIGAQIDWPWERRR